MTPAGLAGERKADEMLAAVREIIRAKGWERVTITVRADGRVHLTGEDRASCLWREEADLLPGGPLPTVGNAFRKLVGYLGLPTTGY